MSGVGETNENENTNGVKVEAGRNSPIAPTSHELPAFKKAPSVILKVKPLRTMQNQKVTTHTHEAVLSITLQSPSRRKVPSLLLSTKTVNAYECRTEATTV